MKVKLELKNAAEGRITRYRGRLAWVKPERKEGGGRRC